MAEPTREDFEAVVAERDRLERAGEELVQSLQATMLLLQEHEYVPKDRVAFRAIWNDHLLPTLQIARRAGLEINEGFQTLSGAPKSPERKELETCQEMLRERNENANKAWKAVDRLRSEVAGLRGKVIVVADRLNDIASGWRRDSGREPLTIVQQACEVFDKAADDLHAALSANRASPEGGSE